MLLWRRYTPLGVRVCATDQEMCNLRMFEGNRCDFVSSEIQGCREKQHRFQHCNENSGENRTLKRSEESISTNRAINDSRVPNMMQALHGSFADVLSHLHLDLRHWSQARSRTVLSATRRERDERIVTHLYCFSYGRPCLFWTTNLRQRGSHRRHRRRHIRRLT